MHIFFSGIGGTAIGPLAQIASQAGYDVSGSDKQPSAYINYLERNGLNNLQIGQTREQIATVHQHKRIDWFVYSSAVSMEQAHSEEIQFCKAHGIKVSKRDEFINHLLEQKNLKLIAVAGTHGKTTTTAMTIWLLKSLGIPVSYSVGAKIPFGSMGEYVPGSEYFVLEADEFDRNFLAFKPYLSLITGIDYDHHEIYPTIDDYQEAFRQFIGQSYTTAIWGSDARRIELRPISNQIILDESRRIYRTKLVGEVNRQNARLVAEGLKQAKVVKKRSAKLVKSLNQFPGVSRRFEQIVDGVYSDYAHTPEKIRGCLKTAFELSPNVVVVYEPLTNRRQHFIKDEYGDLFKGVKRLYWVPSYLAREDPKQRVLTPDELIEHMNNKTMAQPASLDDHLARFIEAHRDAGDLVVCLSGGGGASLDEWLRQTFSA